jgi:anti-sigma factor RsiW
MNCKENHKYLDAYLDGELEPSLMLEVETHLEACDGCQSLVLVKRRLIVELSLMGTVKAPDHLRRRIEFMRNGRNRLRNRVLAAAVPLAAAASLLVIFTIQRSPAGEEQLAEVVGDVVARHSVELPMEVKGPDPSLAASWFRGKVDFPVRAPSLNIQQASFEGARLSNVREHQAAHMTYNVEGHRVTLMIFNRQNALFDGGRHVQVDGKDVVLGQQNGFNVAVVLEGDMAYALSSDLSQDRLLTLARQMKI